MSLLTEIKRRGLLKVAVAYIIIAWVLIQVVVAVETPLNLPNWVDTLVILLLIIGFPVALIMSWAYKLSPDEITNDNTLEAESSSKSPGKASNNRATKFCVTSDNVRLAYMTNGEGAAVIKTANWVTHLELDWENSVMGADLHDLSGSFQLTTYDQRGNGLSDWNVDEISLDAFVRDLETVVEASGVNKFALLAYSQSCSVAIAYAVKHPERVTHLVLFGGFLKDWRGAEQIEAMATLMRTGWGQKNPTFRQLFTTALLPDGTKEEADQLNEQQRIATSAENAVRLFKAIHAIDVTALAPKVTTPTLVLHSRDEQGVPLESGREIASLIPGAKFIGLESENHILLKREPAYDRYIEEVFDFINQG